MRFNFHREKFYNAYRREFGGLSQQQVDGFNFLLDSIALDSHLSRIEEVAYMLGTTYHETAFTMQPVHEYGGRAYFIRRYGSQTKVGRGLGNDTPEEGAIYAGRGDVQLTGENNYEKAEDALRAEYPEIVADFERRTGKVFDLTVGDQPGDIHDPDNAQDPAIAYAIMSYGMRTGMFTGLGFNSKRFKGLKGKELFTEWRRIINGTDHASLIAGTAVKFLRILTESFISNSATTSTQSPSHASDTSQKEGDTVADNFNSDVDGGAVGPSFSEMKEMAERGEFTPAEPAAEGTEGKQEPPAPPPVEVKAASMSWEARIAAVGAFLTSIGISIKDGLQNPYVLIVIGAFAVIGYLIYRHEMKARDERTKLYFENAQRKDTPDILVT